MAEQLEVPEPGEWLTTEEVGRHFRVTARTILRWLEAGEFGNVLRLGPGGKTIRIHRSELDRRRPGGAAA